MKFIKKVVIILIFVEFIYCFSNNEKFSNTLSNTLQKNSKLIFNDQLLSVEKFKFLFMLKWPSVKNDMKHPLNFLSYKNVLLSTSQVVFFVSQSPLNSVSGE